MCRALEKLSWCWAVVAGIVALTACEDGREWPCRIAVRTLVKSRLAYPVEDLNEVVSFGRYALPDIEQEFHGATRTARLRLLQAVERIAEPDAIYFLRFVGRHDADLAVRKKALEIAVKLP